MSTLVTTHDGLERVTRGVQFIADAVRPAATRTRVTKTGRGTVAAFFARWADAYRARQQERAFEMLMDLDPRVRAEVEAAAARASQER